MQFAIRTILAITLIVAVLIGGGLWLKRQLEQGIGVAYASWGCGDLLVDYLKSNSNRWPKNWDELETFYNASTKDYVGLGTFAYLKDCFEIDFTFDPAVDSESWIAKPSSERVVQYRSTHGHIAGREANSRILQYLTEHRSEIYDGG